MQRKPQTIEFLSRVYQHPQYKAVHKVLDEVRKTHGFKSKLVVITAHSGSGKSTACRAYQTRENKLAEATSTDFFTHEPILYCSLDEESTPLALTKELLRALGISSPRGNKSDLKADLIEKLKLYHIELIIIDEAHHVLPEH